MPRRTPPRHWHPPPYASSHPGGTHLRALQAVLAARPGAALVDDRPSVEQLALLIVRQLALPVGCGDASHRHRRTGTRRKKVRIQCSTNLLRCHQTCNSQKSSHHQSSRPLPPPYPPPHPHPPPSKQHTPCSTP